MFLEYGQTISYTKNVDLVSERIYMAVFLLVYFGIIIGLRSLLLYRQVKINPIEGFGTKSKIGRVERTIQVLLFLMLIIGLNFIFIKSNYKYFIPIKFLEISWLQTLGFIISMFGLLVSFIAQLQMRNSWRISIDEKSPVQLVTDGFFLYSRNPVYLGLSIGFIGFFLIAPNAGSFIFLFFMFIALNKKIIDEENFLEKESPENYLQYKRKVRKWL